LPVGKHDEDLIDTIVDIMGESLFDGMQEKMSGMNVLMNVE